MLEILFQTLFQWIWDLEKEIKIMQHLYISEIVFCWNDDLLAVLFKKLLALPDRICWTLSLAALQSDTCNNLIWRFEIRGLVEMYKKNGVMNYLAVPEYSLWMIADTFPKMLAYIRAEKFKLESFCMRRILKRWKVRGVLIFSPFNPCCIWWLQKDKSAILHCLWKTIICQKNCLDVIYRIV